LFVADLKDTNADSGGAKDDQYEIAELDEQIQQALAACRC